MRALLLAAGERRQLPVAEMRQADFAERRIDQPLRSGAAGVARAHMDDFLDREREGDVDMLRQHRAVMGEKARRIEVDVALLQLDPALCRAEIAGQHPQQRRFAGAVGADDRDHLAGLDAQIDRIDQRGAANHHRDRLRFEKGAHSETSPRWRSSMPRKNGAPIAAVRMPIGISAGATMVRASVSAPTSRMAPSRAEAGSSRRCAGPIISRNRCGTTMPRKPTTPQTETATPVIADTSTIEIRFSRSTSTPL